MSNEDKTAHIAGKTVRLQFRDRDVYVSPLTFKELAELQSLLRDAVLDDAVAASAKLPPALAERHIEKALEKREAIRIGTIAFGEALSTFDGVVFAFLVALRKGAADLTLEEVREGLTFNNAAEMAKALAAVIGEDKSSRPNDQTP